MSSARIGTPGGYSFNGGKVFSFNSDATCLKDEVPPVSQTVFFENKTGSYKMDPIFVSTISKWQKRDQRKKYIENNFGFFYF